MVVVLVVLPEVYRAAVPYACPGCWERTLAPPGVGLPPGDGELPRYCAAGATVEPLELGNAPLAMMLPAPLTPGAPDAVSGVGTPLAVWNGL